MRLRSGGLIGVLGLACLLSVSGQALAQVSNEKQLRRDRVKLALDAGGMVGGVFVTAVTLHRTVGGNLALLLDRVAASTRDRTTFRGFVQAATALARITGFFIAAAAPVLFIAYMFLQPAFISTFLQSPAGIRALWIALGLEVIGLIWMYYLLRNDY